jgi:hypothetical protein
MVEKMASKWHDNEKNKGTLKDPIKSLHCISRFYVLLGI